MELPIYIDGQQEGTLTLEKQGAVTVARADMRDIGRVVRLSLYGDGEGYLGIPVPEGGRQRLVKRLSPLDLKRLPLKPEYAAERPMEERTGPVTEQPIEAKGGAVTGPVETSQGKHVIWQGGKPYYF